MKLKVQSILNCTLQQAIEYAKQPQLFDFVSRPLIAVSAVEPAVFPQQWAAGTYIIDLKLFGKIAFGKQTLVISCPDELNSKQQFVMYDNGYSDTIKRWHHRITLRAQGNTTHYTDEIDFDAGLMTLVIWAFSKRLYQHRHKRWAELVAADFAQLA